jgi:hypothetical protein
VPPAQYFEAKYADLTMACVDSLLSILQQLNANELQLGTDREPKMLAHGSFKKLSLRQAVYSGGSVTRAPSAYSAWRA